MSQPLLSQLSAVFGDAFAAAGLDPSYGEVTVSQRPELAQFQCNGALAAAKPAGRSPRDVAQTVIDALPNDVPFRDVSIAGPGFINITLTDAFVGEHIEGVRHDERLGVPPVERRRLLVDYGGPNVAKELHVGHLRPGIIGESLKRVLRFAGHEVLGDIHLGDWGLPMGQLIVELEARRPDLPYFDANHTGPYPEEAPVTVTDLNEMYPVAAAAAQDPVRAAAARRATAELQDGRPGYRALWDHFRRLSVDAMKAVYDELNVHFELWYGEASVHDRIGPMIARLVEDGVAVESDGALVVPVQSGDDNKEIPPLMLVNSRGAYTYSTTDLATIDERVEDLGVEGAFYVVDARQSLHFEQLFRAAYKGGVAPESMVLEHSANGTVNGPDGKPLKTREGDLPLLRELIDDAIDRAAKRLAENDLATEYDEAERATIARMVGIAALKYGDLQNHRTSDYVFDLERFSSFEGKTGPYLLYGAVRMKSILREAAERGLAPGSIMAPSEEQERNLMLRLARLPDVIGRAHHHRAPNHVAEYAYELTADFSRFYEACHILRQPDEARQASWLSLVELTLRQLELLLALLAIDVPERM